MKENIGRSASRGQQRGPVGFCASGWRVMCALVLLVCVSGSVQAAERTTLYLMILDGANGREVPARVEVIGSDKLGHVARDALPVGGDCDVTVYDGTLKDALSKLHTRVNYPYTGTIQFYSVGRSVVDVPAGSVRVRVFRGPEYKVYETTVTAAAGKQVEVRVPLERWVDMPATGWYSADDHLHIARPTSEINPYISKMMQAEDLHVGNLLQMGTAISMNNTPQYKHGPAGWYREGDYIIASGEEEPRTHFLGHTITLGATSPLHHERSYLIYRLLWEEAAKQGALNGYAHFGTMGNRGEHFGLPVILHYDLMSFIEVLQFNQFDYEAWYNALNLGFRITPTAGTDYPCGSYVSAPGHERFYTKVKGPFTYRSWLDSVRAGRTFVTTGPMLDFTVDGQEVGSALSFDAPTTVTVEARARFPGQPDELQSLELLQNGVVVAVFPRVDGASQIRFKVPLSVTETSWLAVRGSGNKLVQKIDAYDSHVSAVHAAPIYIDVKNTPPLARTERAKAIAQAWLLKLDLMKTMLRDENLPGLAAEPRGNGDFIPLETLIKERPELLEEIEKARSFFLSIVH